MLSEKLGLLYHAGAVVQDSSAEETVGQEESRRVLNGCLQTAMESASRDFYLDELGCISVSNHSPQSEIR